MYLCNGEKKVDMREHFISEVSKNKGQSFVELFRVDRGEQLVDVGAYSLMPNHFHFLLHERKEGGISEFMRKLCTAYVMYFNKKHERSGHLFEGRYRAKHADNDEYLKYLFAYIHLNPIDLIDSGWKERRITDRAKAEKYLMEYPYSSYIDHAAEEDAAAERLEKNILNTKAFPEYFSKENFGFKEQVKEWLFFEEDAPKK
jgi:putative transposase